MTNRLQISFSNYGITQISKLLIINPIDGLSFANVVCNSFAKQRNCKRPFPPILHFPFSILNFKFTP